MQCCAYAILNKGVRKDLTEVAFEQRLERPKSVTQTPEGGRGSGPEDAHAVWSGSSPAPQGRSRGSWERGEDVGCTVPTGERGAGHGLTGIRGCCSLQSQTSWLRQQHGANVFQNSVQGLKLLLPVRVCLAPPVSLRLWVLTPFHSSAFLCVLSAIFSGKALNPVSMEHALGICNAPGLLRYFISGVPNPQATEAC